MHIPDGQRFYYWAMAPAAVLVAIFFAMPLLQVLWLSVSEPVLGLQNYAALIDNALLHRVWLNTLRICALTTVFAVFAGYLVAYVMVQVGEQHRFLMIFCIVLTFWLSVLIRAFAWVMILRTEGVVNATLLALGLVEQPLRLVRNETGVLIGMTHYMLPVAVLPMYSSMTTISRTFIDAARGLGAGAWQTFLLVYLPLSKPGIIAAAVLVFIFSLGFYITPAILGGGRVVMIAEYIRVSFDETLRWGYAAMLASTLLIALSLGLALLARVVNVRKVFGA
jgi:putative spermidine/putrescine transport system permease protein